MGPHKNTESNPRARPNTNGGNNEGPHTRPQRPAKTRPRRTIGARRRKATTAPFSARNGRPTRADWLRPEKRFVRMMVIGRDLNSGMLGLSPGSQSPIRTEFRIGQEGLAFRVRCPGIRQSPSGRNCPVLAVHAHDAGQRCVVETIIAEPGFSSSPGIIARNSQTAVELYAQIENHLVENRGQRRYVRLARASHTQGCATLAMISWAHANTDWDQNLTRGGSTRSENSPTCLEATESTPTSTCGISVETSMIGHVGGQTRSARANSRSGSSARRGSSDGRAPIPLQSARARAPKPTCDCSPG